MMTFLKKAGAILLKATEIFTGLQPFLTTLVPASAQSGVAKGLNEIEQLSQLIVTIEAIGQGLSPALTGAQKATAIGPLVAQAVNQSTLMIGKKIANPTEWQAGAVDLAGGLARMLNAVHEDSATSVQPQDVKS